MPELEQNTQEHDEKDDIENQYEKGSLPFLALLSFLLALICLSIYINRHADFISSILLLTGVLIFGLGGVAFLQRKDSAQDLLMDDSGMINSTNENEESEASQPDEEEEQDDDEAELRAFETLVEEALASIPEEFQEKMENLVVLVESRPSTEELQRAGPKEGYTLLGLYSGTPLTAQGHGGAMLPERITIYQHTIEAYCHSDPDCIREQVRKTVLHEVAHHFGIAHEEMPIWMK